MSLGLLFSAVLSVTYLPSDYGTLFRDVGAVDDTPVSQGLYSQLGLMIWSLAAGSLLLTLLTRAGNTWGATTAYLFYGLILTSLLAADDGFRIHETVFANLLGWPEEVAFVLYGLVILAYFVLFYRQLLYSPYPILLIALGCLGGSMAVDLQPALANYVGRQGIFLLEDGLKLTGIVFWLVYHLLAGRRLLRRKKVGPNTEKRVLSEAATLLIK